jgi:multiple sugar transport system substrate-binding protein
VTSLKTTRPVRGGAIRIYGLLAVVWSAVIVLSGGCLADSVAPPRATAVAAIARETEAPTPTRLVMVAPTPSPGPSTAIELASGGGGEESNTISLWVNESSPDQRPVLQDISDSFAQETGTLVDVVMVSPDRLPELVGAAAASGSLPDLILHPVTYSHGWLEQGILDPQVPTQVLGELGRESFREGTLEILHVSHSPGSVAALPSDGWQLLAIYRQDWFDALGLAPPNSFQNLLAAAEVIFDPDSVVSGLVVPTDSGLVSTQQVFELLATANGCELVDSQGQVTLLHPACLEALDYYRQLVNAYSPVGVQTDISALNAYLAGRTGIIVASPAVLPVLAGLDPLYVPSCPECADRDYLARNSGMVSALVGSGELASEASFTEITALGVSTSADAEAAGEFVAYWFNDGYLKWLAASPERRVPMRTGTAEDQDGYVTAWRELNLPGEQLSLADFYGIEAVGAIERDILPTERWGFEQGQGALVTRLHDGLVLSPWLQEMLSGYFTSSQTIVEMYRSVVNLIPGYAFPLDVQSSTGP